MRHTPLSDIRAALDCGVPHVSAYQLTIEPNTAFYSRPPQLPEHDACADMQLAVEDLSCNPGSSTVVLHFRGAKQDSHRLIELAGLEGIQVTEEMGGTPPMTTSGDIGGIGGMGGNGGAL